MAVSNNSENFPVAKDGKHIDDSPAPFGKELARSVTSIVGLKEAVTSEHVFLKLIWSLLLILGVCATGWFIYSSTSEYLAGTTVTKVEVIPNTTYDYPPFFVCPSTWVDETKAISMGYTRDIVRYSLGYYCIDCHLAPKNINVSAIKFFQLYHYHGFKTLGDYFTTIAVNIQAAESQRAYGSANSSSWCADCNNSSGRPGKSYFDGKVCYRFDLNHQDGHVRKPSSRQPQKIMFKITDSSHGLGDCDARWLVFVTVDSDAALNFVTGSQQAVIPYTAISLRISTQHFISLSHDKKPCVTSDPRDFTYSSKVCYARCIQEEHERSGRDDCLWFSETTARTPTTSDDPKTFCNLFDLEKAKYWERRDYMLKRNEEISQSYMAVKCEGECPERCDRMIHEMTLRSQTDQYHLSELAQIGMGIDRAKNISSIEIDVELTALSQGGIFTMTEINSYSLATLISNLGGSLGLFLGGTMMTFVQFVLFGVKIMLDHRRKIP